MVYITGSSVQAKTMSAVGTDKADIQTIETQVNLDDALNVL